MSFALLHQENNANGYCYGFEARLHRPRHLNFETMVKSKLKVLSKPQSIAATMPVLVGPETQRVKQCCCFNKGRSVLATMVTVPTIYVAMDMIVKACCGANCGLIHLLKRGVSSQRWYVTIRLCYGNGDVQYCRLEVSIGMALGGVCCYSR